MGKEAKYTGQSTIAELDKRDIVAYVSDTGQAWNTSFRTDLTVAELQDIGESFQESIQKQIESIQKQIEISP